MPLTARTAAVVPITAGAAPAPVSVSGRLIVRVHFSDVTDITDFSVTCFCDQVPSMLSRLWELPERTLPVPDTLPWPPTLFKEVACPSLCGPPPSYQPYVPPPDNSSGSL